MPVQRKGETTKQYAVRRRTYTSYGRRYENGKVTKSNYEKPFCSWDGEGADIDGEHQYVLLKNDRGHELIVPEGIPTQTALDFLCNGKLKHPECIHVVFGGGYDVNMILRDLPYKHMQMLQKNHRVFWHNFNINYIPRKYFTVSRYPKNVFNKRKAKPDVSITLWDTIGFFQGTFVKSIKEYFKSEDEQAVLHVPEIEEGKTRRGTFTEEDLRGFVSNYTQLEVLALTRLMDRLRDNFKEAGIHLQRWDGAGAAAAAVLKMYNVKQYYPVNTLTELELPSQIAYGGGHVEMFKYGHTKKKTYHYDIIGAYPSVMPLLVNLSNGNWVHQVGKEVTINADNYKNYFGMYKIYWDYRYAFMGNTRVMREEQNPVLPFFYRMPWSEPRIFYPEQGYSWVWWPELEKAMKWGSKLGGELRIVESWVFEPGDDIKPFDWVAELYKKRLEYKALGMGAALALKLAINSLYGKLAQTVGYDERKDKRPPYYNLLWAGFITSYIRAKMFDAAMQAPDKIIAMATDGIWSQVPLDLDVGLELGQWEAEVLSSFTSVQAGVYFAKKEEDEEEVYHYRGFNQGSIREADVIEAYERQAYAINIDTRRFVTMGTAIASEKRFTEHWRRWEEDKRRLELFPGSSGKRFGTTAPGGRGPSPLAATQLLDTTPNMVMRFQEEVHVFKQLRERHLSRPHPLPWSEPHELSDMEIRIKEDEAYQWEVTESEA